MNSLYASLSLIFAEIILLLLVVCGTLVFLKVKEQRKDKKALLALTEKIKESKEERLNVLSIKLKETHDLDSDALSAAAKKIRDIEIEFYITMMNIYADRDSEALKTLDKNIVALTESSTRLGTISIDNSSPATTVTNGEELKNENTRLQYELNTSQQLNNRLEKELDTAKKEMRETVSEFISAFSGGRNVTTEKIAEKENSNATSEEIQQDQPPVFSDDTPIKTEELPADIDNTEASTEMADEAVITTIEDSTDETPVLTENTEPAAPTSIDEPDADADDNNPFFSIDENAIPGSDAEPAGSTIDRATDKSDLEIDPGLDTDSSSSPPEGNAKTETTDTPAVDDIDALLVANSNTPATAPTEVKNTDKNFDPDDIDALLAAAADSETAEPASDANKTTEEKKIAPDDIDALLATNTASDEKTVAPATEKELDVSVDDIDAILEDIDLTTASAIPSDNREVEKAS